MRLLVNCNIPWHAQVTLTGLSGFFKEEEKAMKLGGRHTGGNLRELERGVN